MSRAATEPIAASSRFRSMDEADGIGTKAR